MRNLLGRGGRLTLGAAVRPVVLFIVFALGGWLFEITLAAGYLFAFFFAVSLLLPLALSSKFFNPRSNLASPYDRWLPRVRSLVYIADFFLVAGVVLLILEVPAPLLLMLLLTLVYSGCATVILARHISNRRQYPAWQRRFLSDYSPEFVLHTPRSDGGSYQIQMWLPTLETLERNFLLLVRSPRALAALQQVTDRPVIVCENWSDLDAIMTPNIRAVFYVNSVGANADLLTYREAQHVYLGHGDSGKPLSVHPLHRAFDYVAVAGQAARDRYERAQLEIPARRLLTIGRPELNLGSAAAPRAKRPDTPPTVIYAPTWSGYNAHSGFSSLASGEKLVTRLVGRGYRVIFRPHPLSLRRSAEIKHCARIERVLEAHAESSGIDHQFGTAVTNRTFPEIAALGDALIADRSSVITDFLVTQKPIAEIVVPGDAAEITSEAQPAFVYELRRDFENLYPVLDLMFGVDPLASKRRAAADYLIDPATAAPDHFAHAVSFLFSAK